VAAKNLSVYSELLTKVKDQGLLKKHPAFYGWSFAVVTLLSLMTWAGIILMGVFLSGPMTLLVLPLIVFQGLLTAQYAFIAHELAHNQVFEDHRANTWVGMVMANLFAGLSYGFWLQKHNRHHGKPNMVDSDPDISLRIIAFSTEQKFEKPSAERMLTRNQGWLFPVLIFLTSFDLLLDSFKSLGRKTGRGANLRWIEGAMLVVRLLTPIAVYLLFLPLWVSPIAWMAYMLSFGFFLGAAFAVNHIGMPLVEKSSRIGFLERQVLTSRNITPSRVKDTLLGGLNYQIEHHLFPSMARPNLARVRPIVQEFCREKGIAYKEMGLFSGFGEVVRFLNGVGLSTKVDPFICPLMAELRTNAVPLRAVAPLRA